MAERVRATSRVCTIKRKYSGSEEASEEISNAPNAHIIKVKDVIEAKTKRTASLSVPEPTSEPHSSPDIASSTDSCSKTTDLSPDNMGRESSLDLPPNISSWNVASTEQVTSVGSIYNITMTGSTDLSVLLHLGFGDVYTATGKLCTETHAHYYIQSYKFFSDNLLNLLDDEKKSERKYHQLFMSFALICGLRIFDGPDTSFSLKCNQKTSSFIPDALVKGFGIYKDTDGSHFVTKVAAVVEAKRIYGKEDEESRTNNLRNRTIVPHQCASHVDDHVKAQHIGEMLAVVQSGQSLFGFRGIYGLLVQETKVTLVYYRGTKEYFQQISGGKPKLTAEVLYSNHFNILARDGRRTLISLLIDMENFTKREMEKKYSRM
ncbi:unnamed protein product [Mytilus coruscus]|uniref:Uncharacterized protein n=1 Tax=Mytilus coruscus TaxID=42192 RepID=A0A6J8ERN8_MYTCO|nr:unnamed protein product [Mytilus coruscus]